MSMLGEITAKLGGQQGQEGGLASLQQLVSSSGGLQGLTSKLASSGLGQQVQSWVGHGQNQSVSGSEIKDAMDPSQVHAMAQQAGMSDDETCNHVAKALPDMVDQATPQGHMPAPQEDPFSRGMDSVKHLLKL
ncbi:MAG TPA: YidB family protein [Streptosporangiaceae bacterium]|nr:YidB family protein [Streptosporangiaceae bacterium]